MKGARNSEPRPAASLTGALLARRGGAHPAMRRQPILSMTGDANHSEDLGWNDPGGEKGGGRPAGTNVQPLPRPMHDVVPTSAESTHLLARMNAPADKRSLARKQPASPADMERKVAFTLRIDAERHLRLRLLSALSKRSAQRLLTEALDIMIAQSAALNALMESSAMAVAGEKKRKI